MSLSPEPRNSRPQVVNAAQYMGYGLTWALSTGLFLLGGWLVDRWLGTVPWLTITGAFVGAAAGFYSLYYHLVLQPRMRSDGSARELLTRRGSPEGQDGEGGAGRSG